MAIDSANRRKSAANVFRMVLGPAPGPDASLDNAFDRGWLANYYGGLIVSPAAKNTVYLFDVRVLNRAISESDGRAVGADNLGSVSYYYDDIKNNQGRVTLPYG